MQAATIAIEDERFYKHGGVDYEGILRAAIKNIEAGKTVEGGSTITQQLVRNLYVGRERTLQRKIREARLAEELEHKHSKRWILQSYLNSVALRDGRRPDRGRRPGGRPDLLLEAARKNLTLEESALLAGLPQAPSELNPFQNPKGALDRRNEVLDEDGEARLHHEGSAPRGLGRSRSACERGDLYTKIREPFFFDYVKQQLIDRFGVNTVRKGGLQGLHDDRPEAPEGRPRGDRLDAQLPGRPELGGRRDRSRAPATSARWPRARTTAQPVQPRRAGTPPAGLGVQDVRAHDRDQARHQPEHHQLRLASRST